MKKSAMILSLGLVTVLFLTSGCGPGLPDGMPKLYPTTVTITVDGKPAEEAYVTAFPTDASFTWPLGGMTDAQGKISFIVDGKYEGAPEGELIICVKKTRTVTGPTYDTPRPTESLSDIQAWEAQCEKEREEYLVVGADYNVKETSPLKMTVTKGKNAETFDIPEDGTQIKFAQ